MNNLYVQYGCGHSSPAEWLSFDSSPTLRIQKIPIIGPFIKKRWKNTYFGPDALYGDIVKGLPLPEQSCDGLYCSHTLEHLSLEECRKALANSYKLLKKGGIFRCVLPDLAYCARTYLNQLEQGDTSASLQFMGPLTLLGVEHRSKDLKSFIISFFGNANHLWMWDYASLSAELQQVGFTAIRPCAFNDSGDPMFALVEEAGRFENALAIECIKR
ncbi:MAG: methyltransferase domain-containing protein [Spirosomataceae bacterium]